MRRYALRDDQWDRIKDILPGREGHVGVTAKDNRLFVEAVTLPLSRRHPLAGPCRNVLATRSRFTRDFRAGPRAAYGRSSLRCWRADADNEYAMIDSTIVRAHQHSAGAQKKTAKTRRSGAAKADLSTKIHALVDALGNPLDFILTQGQAHDLEGADAMLPDMAADDLAGRQGLRCR